MHGYDLRYLAGILLFNAGDFFEAHEVWEDLWADSHDQERRFYQGLIQASVGLCHFVNGNLGGAAKLYRSSRDYLSRCESPILGLDLEVFLADMEVCFSPVLQREPPDKTIRPEAAKMPQIKLVPSPENWPDPDDYLPEEE